MEKVRIITEFRVVLKVALALAFGYLGEIVINLTDNVMIARLGPDALGAVGIASSVFTAIATLGHSFAMSVMIFVSQAYGLEKREDIPKIIHQGLCLVGLFSIPTCFLLWNLKSILELLKQEEILINMASQYMNYFLWSVFPILGSLVCIFTLTAINCASKIMLVLWIQVGLNILLNYVFMFGKFGFPEMGIAGAGLSSALVHSIGMILYFKFIDFKFPSGKYLLFNKIWRHDFSIMRKMAILGCFKGFEMITKNTLYSAIALMSAWFGAEAIASYTIIFQIYLIINAIVSWSVANSVTVRIGFIYAQRNKRHLWISLGAGIGAFFCFLFTINLVLWNFPSLIINLFTGSDGAYTYDFFELTSSLILLLSFFVIAEGLRTVISQGLNGLVDIKVPALMSVFSHWLICLPVSAFFCFIMGWGVVGLWYGLIIGMCIATVAFLLRFWLVVQNLDQKLTI